MIQESVATCYWLFVYYIDWWEYSSTYYVVDDGWSIWFTTQKSVVKTTDCKISQTAYQSHSWWQNEQVSVIPHDKFLSCLLNKKTAFIG